MTPGGRGARLLLTVSGRWSGFPRKGLLISAWACLALLGWATAGEADIRSEPSVSEPVPWLAELRAARARTGGYRARLRHVTPGEDGWLSERYDEEIEARLKELATLLAAEPRDPAKLAAFVHPTFRGTPLAPLRRLVARQAPPVVERLEYAASLSVTAEQFPAQLESFLAGLRTLARVKFKVISISIDPDDSARVQTRVWYDLVGRRARGQVEQRNGHWQLTWQRNKGESWQLTELKAEPSQLVHSPRPHFTDITRKALPDSPASEQLARGLEYWTLNLDAAFLVSQEGHQGLAVADVDGDGWEDFYVAQPSGLPNRLFRNNGDGTFTDIAAAAGVDVLDRTAAPLFFDYDNDGDPDLLLLLWDGPQLFRNQGGGVFSPEDSERIGLRG